jgi:hypothetical protein
MEYGRDRDHSLDTMRKARELLKDIDDWSAYPADPRVALEQEILLLENYRPSDYRVVAREILEMSQLTRHLQTREHPLSTRYLRRTLKMELGHARLAVLRRDPVALSTALNAARDLLTTRFIAESASEELLERMTRISGWTPAGQVPQLGATLAILDQRRPPRDGQRH